VDEMEGKTNVRWEGKVAKVTRKRRLHVTFSGAKSEIAGAISEIAIPYTNDVSARDCTSVSVPSPYPVLPLPFRLSSHRFHGCVGGPELIRQGQCWPPGYEVNRAIDNSEERSSS